MPYEYGGYDLSRIYHPTRVPGVTIYTTLMAHIGGCGSPVYPHHPLACNDDSTWDLNEDGMACKHASVPMTEERLQAAINFSIATLIIELGSKL